MRNKERILNQNIQGEEDLSILSSNKKGKYLKEKQLYNNHETTSYYDNSKQKSIYQELFEKSADAILILKNGKFIDCNQATVNLLKYKEKKRYYKHILRNYHHQNNQTERIPYIKLKR